MPPAPVQPALSPRVRAVAAVLLLLVGVQLWLVVGDGLFGERRQLWTLLAGLVWGAIVAAVPRARAAATALLDRLRAPSPRARRVTAAALAPLAIAYLYWTAAAQGRQFRPVIQDEYCYLIQSRMAAEGRLWMPRRGLADFFDSFHLIVDPVYAAKYSPGTALLTAPALALGLPFWIVPLLLSGACVSLLYLLVIEWLDGAAGLLAALMLLTLGMFRKTSIAMLSQVPMLFLALVALWAFLHWRRERANRWLVVAWLAVGFAAITRPADAAVLAAAIALGVVAGLRGENARRIALTLAAAAACLAPFLAIQLVCNKNITGYWTRLPWSHYAQRNDPYDTPSLAPYDPAVRSASAVPQIRLLEGESTVPEYRRKLDAGAIGRTDTLLRKVTGAGMPHPLMLVLVPPAILGLAARGRWVGLVLFAGFVLIYSRHTFFIWHYATTVAPVLILLVLLGLDALARNLPRAEPAVRIVGGTALLALTLASLPQFMRLPESDDWPMAPLLRDVDRWLDALPQPSIVLFRFDPRRSNVHAEPVYNAGVAWPDDARVIRAHDLGPDRNRALFAYYARLAPDRKVYRYDRLEIGAEPTLTELGTVRELAAAGGGR